jgi:hypothetical protein
MVSRESKRKSKEEAKFPSDTWDHETLEIALHSVDWQQVCPVCQTQEMCYLARLVTLVLTTKAVSTVGAKSIVEGQ